MISASPLIVSCGFSKFLYTVRTASGNSVGELRLKTLPKDPIRLDIAGKPYRIDYAVISNRLVSNDFRFELIGDDGPIASAQKVTGQKQFAVVLGGVEYRYTNQSSLLALRFALTDAAGKMFATVAETTGFSLWRRRFRIDRSEGIDDAVAMFVFFLAVNLQYR